MMDEVGGASNFILREARNDDDTTRLKILQAIMDKYPEKWQSNAGPAANYEDDKKMNLVKGEKNITLFLNTEVIKAKMSGNKIKAVIGKDIETGKETIFKGALFADCTGDGLSLIHI